MGSEMLGEFAHTPTPTAQLLGASGKKRTPAGPLAMDMDMPALVSLPPAPALTQPTPTLEPMPKHDAHLAALVQLITLKGHMPLFDPSIRNAPCTTPDSRTIVYYAQHSCEQRCLLNAVHACSATCRFMIDRMSNAVYYCCATCMATGGSQITHIEYGFVGPGTPRNAIFPTAIAAHHRVTRDVAFTSAAFDAWYAPAPEPVIVCQAPRCEPVIATFMAHTATMTNITTVIVCIETQQRRAIVAQLLGENYPTYTATRETPVVDGACCVVQADALHSAFSEELFSWRNLRILIVDCERVLAHLLFMATVEATLYQPHAAQYGRANADVFARLVTAADSRVLAYDPGLSMMSVSAFSALCGHRVAVHRIIPATTLVRTSAATAMQHLMMALRMNKHIVMVCADTPETRRVARSFAAYYMETMGLSILDPECYVTYVEADRLRTDALPKRRLVNPVTVIMDPTADLSQVAIDDSAAPVVAMFPENNDGFRTSSMLRVCSSMRLTRPVLVVTGDIRPAGMLPIAHHVGGGKWTDVVRRHASEHEVYNDTSAGLLAYLAMVFGMPLYLHSRTLLYRALQPG